tara:strand:+ start:394 stop:603 length:210 start_codon:yes stop_codon:yes gene_type:complete
MKTKFNKPEKTWIRFAIQCIEEQIELLRNAQIVVLTDEGCVDEDATEQAIRARQLNIANLRTMLDEGER